MNPNPNPHGTAYPHSFKAFQAALANKNNPPLFLFTMGKVASKTLGRSLENVYPGALIHAHAIHPNGFRGPGSLAPNHPDPRFRAFYHHFLIARKPTRILSPTRQSFPRNVSDFFENFNRYVPTTQPLVSFSPQQLVPLFYAYQPHFKHAFFFDLHLTPLTLISPYSTPFIPVGPHNAHAKSYSLAHLTLLTFPSEIPDPLKILTINTFLNLTTRWTLTHFNSASQKPYAHLYQQFKSTLNPSPHYLNALSHTQYHQFFYPIPQSTTSPHPNPSYPHS